MATRTVTSLVDDLDGSAAEENLSFGLDWVEYEIDLSAGHAQALREAFAPYLAAARRVGAGARPARGRLGPRNRTATAAQSVRAASARRSGPGRPNTVSRSPIAAASPVG